MAKDFAKKFYVSATWIKTSKAFAASKFYVCERCGKAATRYIVHHKVHLTPENINNPAVALDWKNLQLLCVDCHNIVHKRKRSRQVVFNEFGQVVGVKDSPRPDFGN